MNNLLFACDVSLKKFAQNRFVILILSIGLCSTVPASVSSQVLQPLGSEPANVLSYVNSSDQLSLGFRAGTEDDRDLDGVKNVDDLDDDNDGIPDAIEGGGDIDADGIANHFDLDSDNDGIPDFVEAITDSTLRHRMDANDDGVMDSDTFLGSNGLADAIESSPDSGIITPRETDSDNDSILDQFDLDSDNDGISDVVEAFGVDADGDARVDQFKDDNLDGFDDTLAGFAVLPPDTDSDGLLDYRDLDSDADGLSDALEGNGVDTDSNGRVDNFTDNDFNGIYDNYTIDTAKPIDTDQDGQPDYLDLDSDNDGALDSEEAFGLLVPDTGPEPDSSPTTDDPDEGADNGIILVTGEKGNVFGCSVLAKVTQGHSSASSKNDVMLLLLFVLSSLILLKKKGIRMLHRISARYQATQRHPNVFSFCLAALFGLSLTGCALQPKDVAFDLPNGAYVGMGVGAGFLTVNTENTGLEQDGSVSPAVQLTGGLYLRENISLELRAADLGDATFTNGDALGYQVLDASAVLSSSQRRKFNFFTRLGVGALFNNGSVDATQENRYHLLVGGGVAYNLSPDLQFRAEFVGHDVDVKQAQLSFIYRYGREESKSKPPAVLLTSNPPVPVVTEQSKAIVIPKVEVEPTPILDDIEQWVVDDATQEDLEIPRIVQIPPRSGAVELGSTATTVDENGLRPLVVVPNKQPQPPNKSVNPDSAVKAEPAVIALAMPELTQTQPSNPDVQNNEVELTDSDRDGVADSIDACVNPDNNLYVTITGCALFGGPLDGFEFEAETDQLTDTATNLLDQISGVLNADPELRLNVVTHTAESEEPQSSLILSRRRALAIVRYLSDQGVASERLTPEAYGQSRPVESDAEASERVEFILQ